MVVSGIISKTQGMQMANLINNMLAAEGKRVSIMDSTALEQLSPAQLKCYIQELEANRTDILILCMMPDMLKDNIVKTLQFDIMLYADKADDTIGEKLEHNLPAAEFFSLLGDSGTAIINVDDTALLRQLNGIRHRTITYGFNTKASVTPSSTGDGVLKGSFMCCVQRTIPTVTGELVEPREFMVVRGTDQLEDDHILAAATFAIVNGMDMDRVECGRCVEAISGLAKKM